MVIIVRTPSLMNSSKNFTFLCSLATVRRCWNSCQMWKNLRAIPSCPEMVPLPPYRLNNFIRRFTFTGINFFRPMEVTTGRRREKGCGVLFTCLSTRAAHLKLANSLRTDSGITVIRRLISRRGCPKDSVTTFHGA